LFIIVFMFSGLDFFLKSVQFFPPQSTSSNVDILGTVVFVILAIIIALIRLRQR
jgi:hypothetical protein